MATSERAAQRSRRYRFITFLWVRFGLFRHAAEQAAMAESRHTYEMGPCLRYPHRDSCPICDSYERAAHRMEDLRG